MLPLNQAASSVQVPVSYTISPISDYGSQMLAMSTDRRREMSDRRREMSADEVRVDEVG